MMKAQLQIKTLSTEAVTTLSPLINDGELQLAGIAGLLDPIGEQLAAIYTMSESCMANTSRAAVLTHLKIDPAHIKLMDMTDLYNKLNLHSQPLS